jgi:hypothetical protein
MSFDSITCHRLLVTDIQPCILADPLTPAVFSPRSLSVLVERVVEVATKACYGCKFTSLFAIKHL